MHCCSLRRGLIVIGRSPSKGTPFSSRPVPSRTRKIALFLRSWSFSKKWRMLLPGLGGLEVGNFVRQTYKDDGADGSTALEEQHNDKLLD
jgi:hypothetical protein